MCSTESKPEDPAKFTEADAKKQCGLCGYKAEGKGDWRCTSANIMFDLPRYDCPSFLDKPQAQRPPQLKKKGLPVPPGVKFIYLGRPEGGSREHQGVVTVAWISPGPGVLHLGFSFCNPGQKGLPPGLVGSKPLTAVSMQTGEPYYKGRPAVPPDSFCKAKGRDLAMKNLNDDPLMHRFLYSAKRAVCDVVKAVLSHDPRLKYFATWPQSEPRPPLLQVPSWTRALTKPKPQGVMVSVFTLGGLVKNA